MPILNYFLTKLGWNLTWAKYKTNVYLKVATKREAGLLLFALDVGLQDNKVANNKSLINCNRSQNLDLKGVIYLRRLMFVLCSCSWHHIGNK